MLNVMILREMFTWMVSSFHVNNKLLNKPNMDSSILKTMATTLIISVYNGIQSAWTLTQPCDTL